MRIHEIIPYIDAEKMTAKTFIDIWSRLERMQGPEGTDDVSALELQYGDPLYDIEVEQARLNLEQTKAEIARLRAEATSDLADAARQDRND
jgi:hypothetical protein